MRDNETQQQETQENQLSAHHDEQKAEGAEEQPTTPASDEQQTQAEEPKADEDSPDNGEERAHKAATEAKRYRLQLRETQAELEAARTTVSELEETLITYLGEKAGLAKPEALIKAGFNGKRLRDENGALLSLGQLSYEINQFADEFGLAFKRGTPMPPDPSQLAEPISGDTWEDSFKMH